MNTPAELLAKAKSYSKADTDDYFANIAKGSVNGAITGGAIGAIVGYYKSYNIYGSILVGLILGGVISNQLIKFKN